MSASRLIGPKKDDRGSADEDIMGRILKVAAQLFREKGYAATTVREIGERAGIGQSSLYYHIESKARILQELHETFIQRSIQKYTEVVGSNATPTEQMRRIIEINLWTVETHHDEVTVFLREGYALPEDAMSQIREKRDWVDSMIDSVLRRGIDTGEFRRDLNVQLTRLAILGMCNWSYQWFRPSGSQTMADIGRYFSDFALKGMGEED
jgi:TetR/AcrR family transcriptional regulator, cholesterol catabolism regulator